jgi:HPr kinase/phosphorylase
MTARSVDALLSDLGLERVGAPCTRPVEEDLQAGFFHPRLPRALQVAGCAADALCSEQPWRHAPPACLVIGSDAKADAWTSAAAGHGLPCYRSPWTSQVTVDRLRRALIEATAPRQWLHATLLRLYDLGVLLLGASGAGKSELALELIARGHALVADDSVEVLLAAPGCLLGRCPPELAGFIEVRGLGILDVRAGYGDAALVAQTRIDLAIRLDGVAPVGEARDRVHGRRQTLPLLDVDIPEIVLHARQGHNAVMVEAACRDHWLRCRGYVASDAFIAAHDRRLGAAGAGAPGRSAPT